MTAGAPVPFARELDPLAFAGLLPLALLLGTLGIALLVWTSRRPFWRERLDARVGLDPWGPLAGAALGALLLALTIVPPAIAGHYAIGHQWRTFYYELPTSGPRVGVQLAFLFLIQSLVEELDFRAGLLSLVAAVLLALVAASARRNAPAWSPAARARAWLAAGLGASFLQAVPFAWLHRMNPHTTPLGLFNVALAGALLGWIYVTRGLAASWALHFVWNAGLALLGLPVSGMAVAPPAFGIGALGVTPSPWNGGLFGPEGSILDTLALATTLAALVVARFRRVERAERALASAAATVPVSSEAP